LGEFKGVLVSDFYTAYDLLPCAQQKCLLHLMRDLNDAVLDNPYDEDVKRIVMGFAELCKYSGLDFLDFLRSGETDAGTFAANQWN
jgi:hypothetical protein